MNLDKMFELYIKDAYEVFDRCGLTDGLALDITFKLSKRMTSTIGSCRLWVAEDRAEIKMSYHYFERYLRDGNHSEIMNTILHEMCHAMLLSKKHGEVWKKYASIVSGATNLEIKQYADDDKVIQEMKRFRDLKKKNIMCEKCGSENVVTARVFNKLNDYRCKCGGKLIVLDIHN